MSFKLKALPLALAQVIAGGALTMAIAPVFAQSTPDTTQPTVQRVEVTGSSIRRADAETPSPVQVITSEELKQSGYTSIAQVLGNITANGQGTLSQGFSGAFAAGAQAVSLRGMNSSATLVLIDGHRAASNPMFDDGQRSFVDIGAIPFDAIERVEVLKDGASAQYGSDAMAGVVNIILKKNFTGTTINAEGGAASEGGGATKHVSITSGMGNLESDGYNAFMSLEYRHENPITNASRFGDGEWTNLDFSKYGTGGYNWTPGVPNAANPTPVIPGSVYLYNPNSAISATNSQFLSGPCNSWSMLSSGGCAYKPIGNLQPETENLNIMASFTKKLSGDWELAAKASLFSSTVDVTNAAAGQGLNPAFPQFLGPAVGVNGASPFVVNYPKNFSSSTVTIPANYPGNTLGAPAIVVGLDTSGPVSKTEIQTKNYRLGLDLTGSIGDWDTSTSVTLSRVNQFDNNIGTMNGETMALALNRANSPYNILGGNSLSDIEAIYAPNTTSMYSELGSLEFHASKSLMQLPGGDLGFSFGGAYLYTKIDAPAPDLYQQGDIPNNTFVQFVNGAQSDTSLFAEIAAPITKQLELDAHARYDHFGLSGQNNSFTPSAGFKWTPSEVFALRGTLATGFRAPNVAETGQSGLTFAGPNDTVHCPDTANPAPGTPVPACGPTAVFQTGYNAKPALQPEKSDSATLGMILEPVKGWSSTFDIYDIKVKNQIYTPPPSQANTLVYNSVPVNNLCFGASPSQTAPCTIAPGGLLLYEVAQYENTNDTEVRGWELESHYKWNLGEWGKLYTGLDWSHTMSYILNAGGVSYQLAGTHGPELIGGDTANPKDRIQGTLTWDKGPWDITVVENYISGYTNNDPSYIGELQQAGESVTDNCHDNLTVYSGVQFSRYTSGMSSFPSSFCQTKSFYTTDLTVRYKYNKQLVVHFAANNLFNRQPPYDANTYGGTPYQYNPSLHMAGAIGRFVQGGLTYSF